MATKIKPNKSGILSMRLTAEDYAVLYKLGRKLGIKSAQIVKIALRKLAESEGVAA